MPKRCRPGKRERAEWRARQARIARDCHGPGLANYWRRMAEWDEGQVHPLISVSNALTLEMPKLSPYKRFK